MMRIFNRVSKHLNKSGFDELVEFGKLFLTRFDEGVEKIESTSNGFLDIFSWQVHFQIINMFIAYIIDISSTRKRRYFPSIEWTVKKVSYKFFTWDRWSYNFAKSTKCSYCIL